MKKLSKLGKSLTDKIISDVLETEEEILATAETLIGKFVSIRPFKLEKLGVGLSQINSITNVQKSNEENQFVITINGKIHGFTLILSKLDLNHLLLGNQVRIGNYFIALG